MFLENLSAMCQPFCSINQFTHLPLGETMTGWDFRWSSDGICNVMTSTEPKLVPTQSEGAVVKSGIIHNIIISTLHMQMIPHELGQYEACGYLGAHLLTWINLNHSMDYKEWDEITNSFPKFKGATTIEHENS